MNFSLFFDFNGFSKISRFWYYGPTKIKGVVVLLPAVELSFLLGVQSHFLKRLKTYHCSIFYLRSILC